jgi:cytochrome c553
MVRDRQQPADPRFAVWIGATVVLFLAAVAIGFVLLPSAQQGPENLNLWSVICRAIGLPNRGGEDARDLVIGQPSSTVAWTASTRQMLAQGSPARGAEFATTCGACHGADGVSSDAAFPNLAGQSVSAIYKQLHDFETGARNPMVMGAYIESLSQQALIDLAAYYASLPNPTDGATAAADRSDPAAQRLVEFGDPMRGVAGCTACHGPSGRTQGAPPLDGQQRAYLAQQLLAFKTGARRNDISEQMRSVARPLTEAEIAMLAAYYSSLSPADGR